MRVLVTRPAAQAGPWVESLRALGVDAVALPLIGIEPAADPASLAAAWSTLDQCAFVMFVSANAVQHFMAAGGDRRWPAGVRAGSTGPGTTAALQAVGVAAELIDAPAADAPRLDTEALWARIAARDWRGRRVLVVRGEAGRDWLADTLRAAGAEVEFVAAYRRLAPVWTAAEQACLDSALADPSHHLWLLSSSEAVRHLATLAPPAQWHAARALATHPRIAATAREVGIADVQAVAPRPEAVAAAALAAAAALRGPGTRGDDGPAG